MRNKKKVSQKKKMKKKSKKKKWKNTFQKSYKIKNEYLNSKKK